MNFLLVYLLIGTFIGIVFDILARMSQAEDFLEIRTLFFFATVLFWPYALYVAIKAFVQKIREDRE